MKSKHLLFLAPDEGDGGGTAVATPPAPAPKGNNVGMKASGSDIAPPLEPLGNAFRREMAKTEKELSNRGTTPPPPEKEAEVEKEEGPIEKPAAKEPDKTKQPEKKSALDAALDAEPGKENGNIESEVELPEDLSQDKKQRSEQWKSARTALETTRTKLSEQAKQIAELEQKLSSGGTPSAEMIAENERLKKENDEYKDSMVALNVEFDPGFRAKFIDGRNRMVERASAKAQALGADGAKLTEALVAGESRGRNVQIHELLSDLHEGERARVWDLINEIDRLDDEKQDLKKDPQDAWAKLQATEASKKKAAEAEATNYRKQMYEETLTKIPSELLLMRLVDEGLEGGKEHNADREQIAKEALRLLSPGVTPQELTRKAFWAASGPILQKHLVSTRKALRDALAKVSEYEGADPSFHGGKPKAKSKVEQDLEKPPGQLFRESMASAKQYDD